MYWSCYSRATVLSHVVAWSCSGVMLCFLWTPWQSFSSEAQRANAVAAAWNGTVTGLCSNWANYSQSNQPRKEKCFFTKASEASWSYSCDSKVSFDRVQILTPDFSGRRPPPHSHSHSHTHTLTLTLTISLSHLFLISLSHLSHLSLISFSSLSHLSLLSLSLSSLSLVFPSLFSLFSRRRIRAKSHI